MLILAGREDIVTEFRYSEELFQKLIAPSKKLHVFNEGLHECHNDVESSEFISTLVAWSKQQLQAFQPGQQCPLGNLHEFPSYSNFYLWRGRIIRTLIGIIVFFFLRRNHWKLLKSIVALI